MNPIDYAMVTSSIMIIMILSLPLYKYNIFFRFAESLFVGIAIGYEFVIAVKVISQKAWTPMIGGNYLSIIPIILGLMLFTRYFKKVSYVARWPLALVVGVGTGIAIKGVVEASIKLQLIALALPLLAKTPLETLNNWVMIVGTLSSVSYFIFAKKAAKSLTKVSRVGRFFFMVTFGASFGNIAASRQTFLISCLETLLKTIGIIS